MTAPDVNADVRARFELVMVSAVSPQNNAPYGTFPSYEQAEAVAKLLLKADAEDSPEWCGYLIDRAAHADMAGEARELVEALRLAVCQNEHDMLMTGDELRVCTAALAKFTQEKP